MTIEAPISKCLGFSHDIPSHLVHPRAKELYEHLREFPWDVSCLTYLRLRHEIFSEVFSGKASTTKIVEYLVELRFLVSSLNGWSEVLLGKSPHQLSSLDRRFITLSIANAYHELPEVLKELSMVRDRAFSSAVKIYCEEVYRNLTEAYHCSDIRGLCDDFQH